MPCIGLSLSSCDICRARKPRILCLLLWLQHSLLRIGTCQSPPPRLHYCLDTAYMRSFGCVWRMCWAHIGYMLLMLGCCYTSHSHTPGIRLVGLSCGICQARMPRTRHLWPIHSLLCIGTCKSPPPPPGYCWGMLCTRSFGCPWHMFGARIGHMSSMPGCCYTSP